LVRSAEIEQLHKQRIEIRREKVDLPKRRAELAAKNERLANLASGLGWSSGDFPDVIARMPQRGEVSAMRTLLTQRGEFAAATKNAQTALDEAEEQVRELHGDLDAAEVALDVSALSAVIKAMHAIADGASGITAAERDAVGARSAIEKHLKRLRPQGKRRMMAALRGTGVGR
jgi:hypothetical protein